MVSKEGNRRSDVKVSLADGSVRFCLVVQGSALFSCTRLGSVQFYKAMVCSDTTSKDKKSNDQPHQHREQCNTVDTPESETGRIWAFLRPVDASDLR
ncbi:hypothetical protein BaRGS_00020830 [Batillaria attramentaria]|uniref:Uncharacterized protein n=1 Tax=Batillaria attramentaria TaxID=370345 RepID=A0ABD0KLE2_9CAEN